MDPTGNGDQLFYIRFHLYISTFTIEIKHSWIGIPMQTPPMDGPMGNFLSSQRDPRRGEELRQSLAVRGLGEELDVGFRQEGIRNSGVSFSRPYYSPKTLTAGTPKLALWVDASPFFQPGVFSGEPCLFAGL